MEYTPVSSALGEFYPGIAFFGVKIKIHEYIKNVTRLSNKGNTDLTKSQKKLKMKVCLCGVCVAPTPFTAPCARAFVGCVTIGAVGLVSISPKLGAERIHQLLRVLRYGIAAIIIAGVVGSWISIFSDLVHIQEGRGSGGLFRISSLFFSFSSGGVWSDREGGGLSS